MRLPKIEGLQKSVAMGASELPPVFVGNEKVIYRIELISSFDRSLTEVKCSTIP